ncbi:hypothetical protein E3N88_21719 [Mikania micrantha]|uniref:NAC domain-containing protein n=1 Tax=Mikania micrantha TaxID=192012 RepID=A0A5N6NAY8_9ASTR|nr:hypothetical protein E3N88_21719 [Mikania micrantha]
MMLGVEDILCELGGAGAGKDSDQHGGLPPGFRFHPTDEELITFYLASKVFNSTFTFSGVIHIAEVDLNRCEPWELPEVAKMGEREWYFYSLRDRKYPTGLRTNRATGSGYWKATGKDREVYSSGSGRTLLGMKKTLVFYKGRAPHGEKTKWVMHEYRLDGDFSYRHTCKDEWVICRIFHKLGEKKSNGGQNYLFKNNQSTLPPSPSTPKPSEITKTPFLEVATPLLLNRNHSEAPPHQNPFLFDGIHNQDIKSLINLPTFSSVHHTTNNTLIEPVFPNHHPTHVAKICKTEALFSIQELPEANLHRWGTNYIPSTPLFTFDQPDFAGVDHFFHTSGGGDDGDSNSGTRLGAGNSIDSSNVVVSMDGVGFNKLLLPTM